MCVCVCRYGECRRQQREREQRDDEEDGLDDVPAGSDVDPQRAGATENRILQNLRRYDRGQNRSDSRWFFRSYDPSACL